MGEDPLSEAADPDEVGGEVADAPLEAEPLADPHSVCWSWRAACWSDEEQLEVRHCAAADWNACELQTQDMSVNDEQVPLDDA